MAAQRQMEEVAVVLCSKVWSRTSGSQSVKFLCGHGSGSCGSQFSHWHLGSGVGEKSVWKNMNQCIDEIIKNTRETTD